MISNSSFLYSSFVVLLSVICLTTITNGFYIPGVAPFDYEKGQAVTLKVNKLTSSRTQIPYDYYSFNFCRPKEIHQYGENLGEFLSGDRIENSAYDLHMLKEEKCRFLCVRTFKKHDVQRFKEAIAEDYHHNWIIDNLPAASVVVDSMYETTYYARGFPVGFMEGNKAYINNHAVIIVDYHELDSEEGKFRVVGFKVRPVSVAHKIANKDKLKTEKPDIPTCKEYETKSEPMPVKQGEIVFTYDLVWEESDVHWASRWDIYLNSNKPETEKVHWFSIVNSLMIVFFLTGMVAMILVRNLCRDITRYNRVPTDEERAEEREESGWKLVHADVFRPPTEHPMMFCVFVGTGCQLFWMALITICFAAIGFLSPANRGSLLMAVLLLYVMLGMVAGYTSARLYKTFKGRHWQKCTILTALWYPATCFSVFLLLDFIIWGKGSTGAVPFLEIFKMLILWFGISVPLVFLGAYQAYKQDPITFPCITSNIPRQIPECPWYLNKYFMILVGGILPFGACFVELFFILTSMWMGYYYYVFGFLLLVFIILLITCAETTIVLCYFQLCAEDYNWWWRSFLCSGSTALYVMLYAPSYFNNLDANLFVTYLLYFGYMGIISLGLFLLTGTIGFLSCMWFTKLIYKSIKVD